MSRHAHPIRTLLAVLLLDVLIQSWPLAQGLVRRLADASPAEGASVAG